jgi:hypothetical protein
VNPGLINYLVCAVTVVICALLSARRHHRQLKAQQAEFRRLLMAEYAYWHDQPDGDPDQAAIYMGAMGAVSNVLAATAGSPAPWHLKQGDQTHVARRNG